MEFDQLFVTIQGILKYHQREFTLHFNKVAKGNDDISEMIVTSLKKVINSQNLTKEHLRKINLFLFINTDIPSVHLLEDDSNYWHLLGCLPKLSSFLYLQIVSELEFGEYVGEIINFGPEFLSIELLQAIHENIKFINLEVSLSFLEPIYESVFYKIVNLQIKNSLPIMIQKFVKIYTDLTSINLNELVAVMSWEITKKHIFNGYHTKMLLSVLKNSIKKMKTRSPENFINLYESSIEFDYTKWGECDRKIAWTIFCLGTLVSKCAKIVKAISVEMYMAWCEVDIKNKVDRTLQTVVREEAYKCCQEIKSIIHYANEISHLKILATSLSNIALHPVTEDDEIISADAETIIFNLLNPKRTHSKWLKGLMSVPGIFQSSKYMKVIQDSAHMFDLEISEVLLDRLYSFLSMSQCPRDYFEVAKDLFFHCVRNLPLSVQIELLSYHFKTKSSSNILQRGRFEESLIISMNKLSSSNGNQTENYCDFIILCFENPEAVMQVLLKECLSSVLKTDLLLDLLTRITPLADIPCSASSLSLTSGTTVHLMDSLVYNLDKKKDNFKQLIQKLCDLRLIEVNVFFPEYILPRLEKSFNDNDIECIVFYLDILTVYLGMKLIPSKSAALLAFLVKALENLRPSIKKFSMERMSATSKLADIVNELAKTLVSSVNNKGSEKWLQEKLILVKPINKVHLRVLWSSNKNMPNELPFWAQEGFGFKEQFIDPSSEARRDVVTNIVKVLPILTLSEWLLIGSLDKVNIPLISSTIDAIIDSVLVSFQIPFLAKNLAVINNILINFNQLIWAKVVPKLIPNEKENLVLQAKLNNFQDMIPIDLQKSRKPQVQLIVQALSDTLKKN